MLSSIKRESELVGFVGLVDGSRKNPSSFYRHEPMSYLGKRRNFAENLLKILAGVVAEKYGENMKILNYCAVALISLAVTGCTCRTAAVTPAGGPAGDNLGGVTKGPLDDIFFAFDSYKLDGAAKATLDKNAAWLKANADKSVTIEGHCDERGTTEYNQVLGANRARSGYNYLRNAGVEASRMSTVSFGEDRPFDPAHNEEAWASNRRDHFEVK